MHLASRGASVAINFQARKDAAEKVGEEAQAKGFGTVKAYQVRTHIRFLLILAALSKSYPGYLLDWGLGWGLIEVEFL